MQTILIGPAFMVCKRPSGDRVPVCMYMCICICIYVYEITYGALHILFQNTVLFIDYLIFPILLIHFRIFVYLRRTSPPSCLCSKLLQPVIYTRSMYTYVLVTLTQRWLLYLLIYVKL
jgi:hypothetical protein